MTDPRPEVERLAEVIGGHPFVQYPPVGSHPSSWACVGCGAAESAQWATPEEHQAAAVLAAGYTLAPAASATPGVPDGWCKIEGCVVVDGAHSLEAHQRHAATGEPFVDPPTAAAPGGAAEPPAVCDATVPRQDDRVTCQLSMGHENDHFHRDAEFVTAWNDMAADATPAGRAPEEPRDGLLAESGSPEFAAAEHAIEMACAEAGDETP